MGEIHSTRGGVFSRRFANDVSTRDLGKLFFKSIYVTMVRDKIDVFGRADSFESMIGPLNQRLTSTEYIKKLLWMMSSAFGPKTAADSASHNSNVVIVIIHVLILG